MVKVVKLCKSVGHFQASVFKIRIIERHMLLLVAFLCR